MAANWDLAGRILYQDGNVIILDKPAGLAVHGGPRTPVHLEAMLDQLCLGRPVAPRLVHRLDRDTSGCLILARHDKAVSRLGRLFGAGKIRKTYWAVVAGTLPAAEAGLIDLPLSKATGRDGWRMLADPAGQPASTGWRCLGKADGLAWLELSPRTGRTHQIRVHCATGLGCPILGDPVYGGRPVGLLHLHAQGLSLPYWQDRPPITVTAPPPPHMLAALRRLGWSGQPSAVAIENGPGRPGPTSRSGMGCGRPARSPR